ncbi:hypothetical protein ACFVAJ_16690 [Agromyces sp. NPDC057679]|uniref:hypothetical protein n=1 Tax=Agromyces sp. NPDC057679 TaxID=3346207 RepID=UPI003671C87B
MSQPLQDRIGADMHERSSSASRGVKRHLALVDNVQRHEERGKDGRFINARTAPQIGLDAGVYTPDLEDFLDGNMPRLIEPATHDELVDAIRSVDGTPDGESPVIHIAAPLGRLIDTDLAGPADGRPLIVNVAIGAGRLRVTSGYVIIRIDSSSPLEISVGDRTDVNVIVEPGRRASIAAHGDSVTTVYVGEGARGMIHVDDERAETKLIGKDTRGFRYTALPL